MIRVPRLCLLSLILGASIGAGLTAGRSHPGGTAATPAGSLGAVSHPGLRRYVRGRLQHATKKLADRGCREDREPRTDPTAIVIGRKAQIGKLSMGSSPSEIIAKLATAPEVKVPREPIGAAAIRGNVVGAR